MTDFSSVTKSIVWMALATLALTASPASAATVYGVRMQGQGIIECQTLERYQPSETGGNKSTFSGCRLAEQTQYVTARIGRIYGCYYEIIGSPDGETVTMEHRFLIPSPGAVNPATGEHFLVYTEYRDYSIGSTKSYIGWRSDHAGEVVAGDWTMEVRYEGRVLGSCTFHVST